MGNRYDWSFLEEDGVKEYILLAFQEGLSPAVKRYVVEDLGQIQFLKMKHTDFLTLLRRAHGFVFNITETKRSEIMSNVQKKARSGEEHKKQKSLSEKSKWTDDYRNRFSSVQKQSRSTEEYHKKASESHTVHNWPSAESWFSDVGGIRSLFESLLAEEGHKVAYETVFPDIPYQSVNTWFRRIGYKFQNLQKFVDYRSNREKVLESFILSKGLTCFHVSE